MAIFKIVFGKEGMTNYEKAVLVSVAESWKTFVADSITKFTTNPEGLTYPDGSSVDIAAWTVEATTYVNELEALITKIK